MFVLQISATAKLLIFLIALSLFFAATKDNFYFP